jgi:hypothetical protein
MCTFRDVIKSNLLKNWKPIKFRKREILSERLNETLGGLATEITLKDVKDNVSVLKLTFGDKRKSSKLHGNKPIIVGIQSQILNR